MSHDDSIPTRSTDESVGATINDGAQPQPSMPTIDRASVEVQPALRFPRSATVENIAEFLRLLLVAGGCIEIRAFKNGYAWKSGYFTDLVAAAKAARNLSEEGAEAVYVTVNPVSLEVLPRAINNVKKCAAKGHCTKDNEIVCRRWIVIDFDSIHPGGVSATDDEKKYAEGLARQAEEFLRSRGITRILAGDSGNGYHLWIRVDLPTKDDGLVERFLKALRTRFPSPHAKVDTSLFNPSQIIKIYGTVARKGDHCHERPHRVARLNFDSVPDDWDTSIDLVLIEAIAAEAPKEKKTGPRSSTNVVATQLDEGLASTPLKKEATPQQILAFLATVPGAASGNGGHPHTFDVARMLVKGFNLNPDAAMEYMQEWNKKCQPPWSDSELEHKLDDMDKKEDTQPRGYLINGGLNYQPIISQPIHVEIDLGDGPPAAASAAPASPGPPAQPSTDSPSELPPSAEDATLLPPGATPEQISKAKNIKTLAEEEDDPDRLARVILAETSVHDPLTATSVESLIFIDDAFYRWSPQAAAYKRLDRTAVDALVRTAIRDEFVRQWRRKILNPQPNVPTPPISKVSDPLVKNVTNTIISKILLPGKSEMPFWRSSELSKNYDPKDVIAVANGLVHLPTLTHLLPSPQFVSTTTSAASFNLEAQCPRWMRFLDEAFGDDDEAKQLLKEFMGYLLVQDNSFHKMLLMVGRSRSGKSTAIQIMEALVGEENVCNPDFADLCGGFDLETMIGKTLAAIPEAEISDHVDVKAAVKTILSITGNDARSIKRKWQLAVRTRLKVRFVISTNTVPKLPNSSGVIARRMLVLNFTRSAEGRIQLDLEDEFKRELSGILNWTIEGLLELRVRKHFIQPKSSERQLEVLQERASPLSAYFEECLIEGGEVDTDALYATYESWCRDERAKLLDKPVFCKLLLDLLTNTLASFRTARVNLPSGKKKTRYYGVSIRPIVPDDGFGS